MIGLCLVTALLVADSTRTEVIFLEGLPAERAILLHQRLLGPAGESTIVLGRQPNVVVVRDTPERLRRFHRILDALDQRGAAKKHIYVRPVRHLAASELARLAEEILAAQEGDDAVKMVPDDRSGQLVVMCRRDTYFALDRLFRRLDAPADARRDREIRVTPAPAGTKPGEFPP